MEWGQKSNPKKAQKLNPQKCYMTHRTTQPWYECTTTIFTLFWIPPKNSLHKWSHTRKYLPNSPTQKHPGIENFKPPKYLLIILVNWKSIYVLLESPKNDQQLEDTKRAFLCTPRLEITVHLASYASSTRMKLYMLQEDVTSATKSRVGQINSIMRNKLQSTPRAKFWQQSGLIDPAADISRGRYSPKRN